MSAVPALSDPRPAAAPAPVPLLRLPGCDRPLAYAAHYWPRTLGNLVRPHRLRATVERPRLAAAVDIPASLRGRWEALFEADAACPLLVNQSVGTLLYTRLFGQLGLNFSRLLHVQHRTEHAVTPQAFAAAQRQQLVCELAGCWRLGEDKALVALRTRIERTPADGGELLALVEDRFMIRRVPRRDWEGLPALDSRDTQRELLRLRKRRPALQADDGGAAQRLALALPADLGRRYGRVSGDHNPVHTTALAARLFGLPRPFAQGLALRNLIVSELHRQGRPLQRLQLTFTQPAYLDQTVQLLTRGADFELQDAEGQVLAFGSAGA